jgi:hypothetical protein
MLYSTISCSNALLNANTVTAEVELASVLYILHYSDTVPCSPSAAIQSAAHAVFSMQLRLAWVVWSVRRMRAQQPFLLLCCTCRVVIVHIALLIARDNFVNTRARLTRFTTCCAAVALSTVACSVDKLVLTVHGNYV